MLLMAVYTKKASYKACSTDKIALLFFLCASLAFIKNISDSSLVEFLKFLSYCSFYFIGRIAPPSLKYAKFLGWFSLLSLIILSAMALTGRGYVTWGSVSTFTGGYFFKTDLAIASLIFLSLTFATLQKKSLLAFSLICAGYLVFKSNARIALPLVVIIPVFITMALNGKMAKLNSKSISLIVITTVAGMAIFSLIDFRSLGMLGFDFSDPFSAANTQGRSVIWAALLQAFSDASFMEKLIGMGLNADTKATNLFSESVSLEGVRAHNSYLYLLLCLGVIGSIAFYWLIYSIYSKAPFLLKQENKNLRIIPTLSCSFLILFVWFSMTTEIIIRPQLMILLFFFSGLHVQSYLKIKKEARRYARALADRA